MTIPAIYKFVNWITGTPVPIDDAMTSALTPTIDPDLQDALDNFLYAKFPALVPGCRIAIEPSNGAQGGNVVGSSTIYYNKYWHGWAPVYDGTLWRWKNCHGLSQTLADTTKSPAATVASTIYDMFLWQDTDGTLRHTRGPAWTNSGAGTSARSAAGALTRDATLNYVVNTLDITNGPLAGRGLWTGAIRTNSANTVDGYGQGQGSGGGAEVNMGYANLYNRLPWSISNLDTGAAYTYNGAGVRQCRASANNQIGWLNIGQSSNMHWMCTYLWFMQTVAAINAFMQMGYGINRTTGFDFSSQTYIQNNQGANVLQLRGAFTGSAVQGLAVGYNFLAMLEQSDGVNLNTYQQGPWQSIQIEY